MRHTTRANVTRLSATVVLIAALVGASAVVVRAGSYGTELPFAAGSGGRVSALGLAGTCLTGQPELQQFNPATMALMDYKKLEFFRTTFFDSKSAYHAIHFAYPMLDYGSLAVSVLRLDVGGIEERDVNNILLSSDLKNAQTRLLLGYAASLHSALSAGINLKVDHQSFGQYSGSGIGLDLGFLATKTFAESSHFRHLRGGLSIQNLIEPSVKLDRDDVPDPLNVTIGAAASYALGHIGFVTALDLVAPRYSPYKVRFGQEIGYDGILAFRFGFNGSTPTVGGGAAWRNVSLDYAFLSEDLGSNHRVSVTIRFGANLDQRREAERAALEAELDRQINSKISELESSQLARTLERAEALFMRAKYDEAATQYQVALLWDADNERALSQVESCRYYQAIDQAQSLMESKNYLEALYHLRRALAYSSDDPEATAMISECNRWIRTQEDQTEMVDRMMKRSIDLYASRRFVEANAGFREILNLAPGNKLASEYEQKSYANIQNQKQKMILEANTFANGGDYATAIEILEQARRLDPTDEQIEGRIHVLKARRGDAWRQTGEVAGEQTGTAYAPVPPSAGPHDDEALLQPRYNEGLRYFEKGDFDGAVRRFQEVWVAAPDYHNVAELLIKAYLFIGMKEYSEENYEKAIIIWERALTVDPNNSKARRYLLRAKEEASRLSSRENE